MMDWPDAPVHASPSGRTALPSPPMGSPLTKHGRLRAKDGWRGDACSGVMAGLVPGLGLRGRVLVVDDDGGTVTAAIRESGAEPVAWFRRALDGHAATPWVPEGPFDAAAVRLPTTREAVEMLLHAAAGQVAPGGRIFLYGTNDEGIKSAIRPMERILDATETLETKRHSRVVASIRPENIPGLRPSLGDWERTFSVKLPEGAFAFRTYPGMFAHGHLDDATRLLIDALPKPKDHAHVLDFGCGAGVLGAILKRRTPSAEIDLLDVNALAIDAARRNAPDARPLLGNGWAAVDKARYDLVVSNPPIHSGVGEDFRVMQELITHAPSHLKKDGELWLVAQRTVPLRQMLEASFRSVAIAAETSQFIVWRAR